MIRPMAKTPAKLDLSSLPAGYDFQLEIKMTEITETESKPILDKVIEEIVRESD